MSAHSTRADNYAVNRLCRSGQINRDFIHLPQLINLSCVSGEKNVRINPFGVSIFICAYVGPSACVLRIVCLLESNQIRVHKRWLEPNGTLYRQRPQQPSMDGGREDGGNQMHFITLVERKVA